MFFIDKKHLVVPLGVLINKKHLHYVFLANKKHPVVSLGVSYQSEILIDKKHIVVPLRASYYKETPSATTGCFILINT